jgi:hypothetical protein
LMPADERRSFMLPPESLLQGENLPGAYGSVRGRDRQTTENSSAPARSSLGASSTGRSGVEDRTGASLGEPSDRRLGQPPLEVAVRRPQLVDLAEWSPVTPSLAKEGIRFVPAQGNAGGLFAGLSSESPRLTKSRMCREASRVPRVPASSKMYPSRTREKPKSRHLRQHNIPICRAFLQASSGLEPSTPSL